MASNVQKLPSSQRTNVSQSRLQALEESKRKAKERKQQREKIKVQRNFKQEQQIASQQQTTPSFATVAEQKAKPVTYKGITIPAGKSASWAANQEFTLSGDDRRSRFDFGTNTGQALEIAKAKNAEEAFKIKREGRKQQEIQRTNYQQAKKKEQFNEAEQEKNLTTPEKNRINYIQSNISSGTKSTYGPQIIPAQTSFATSKPATNISNSKKGTSVFTSNNLQSVNNPQLAYAAVPLEVPQNKEEFIPFSPSDKQGKSMAERFLEGTGAEAASYGGLINPALPEANKIQQRETFMSNIYETPLVFAEEIFKPNGDPLGKAGEKLGRAGYIIQEDPAFALGSIGFEAGITAATLGTAKVVTAGKIALPKIVTASKGIRFASSGVKNIKTNVRNRKSIMKSQNEIQKANKELTKLDAIETKIKQKTRLSFSDKRWLKNKRNILSETKLKGTKTKQFNEETTLKRIQNYKKGVENKKANARRNINKFNPKSPTVQKYIEPEITQIGKGFWRKSDKVTMGNRSERISKIEGGIDVKIGGKLKSKDLSRQEKQGLHKGGTMKPNDLATINAAKEKKQFGAINKIFKPFAETVKKENKKQETIQIPKDKVTVKPPKIDNPFGSIDIGKIGFQVSKVNPPIKPKIIKNSKNKRKRGLGGAGIASAGITTAYLLSQTDKQQVAETEKFNQQEDYGVKLSDQLQTELIIGQPQKTKEGQRTVFPPFNPTTNQPTTPTTTIPSFTLFDTPKSAGGFKFPRLFTFNFGGGSGQTPNTKGRRQKIFKVWDVAKTPAGKTKVGLGYQEISLGPNYEIKKKGKQSSFIDIDFLKGL